MKEWFYADKGVQKGPITEEEIVTMLNSGILNVSSKVWKSGMSDWAEIKDTDLSRYIIADTTTPPPLPEEEINNKFFYVLLTVPLLSTIIAIVIAAFFSINPNNVWWMAWILNTVCCWIDYQMLKNAGYSRIHELKLAFILLIPVYIYKRAKLVNHKGLLYLCIWLVVFAIDIAVPQNYWAKFLGLQGPYSIVTVKEGYFLDDTSNTIEELAADFFDHPNWTQSTENGITRVSVSGRHDGHTIRYIFKMNSDGNEFQVEKVEKDGVSVGLFEIVSMIDLLKGK